MQAFADDHSDRRDNYHFGDFISTSAVREDAKAKFDEIRSTVCSRFSVARHSVGADEIV